MQSVFLAYLFKDEIIINFLIIVITIFPTMLVFKCKVFFKNIIELKAISVVMPLETAKCLLISTKYLLLIPELIA